MDQGTSQRVWFNLRNFQVQQLVPKTGRRIGFKSLRLIGADQPMIIAREITDVKKKVGSFRGKNGSSLESAVFLN
jgi:hypothetical protein